MTMPFGKYRGWDLAELPDDYLAWLRNTATLYDPLLSGVDSEWERRFGTSAADEPHMLYIPPEELQLFAELVSAGFRALAFKYHPDRGGSTATMSMLNGLIERLREHFGATVETK